MTTDHIILGALLLLFLKGWFQGFLKTLLGPAALIIGCAMGFVYYQKTQSLAMSLLISITSPFILTILISLILKFWHKAVNNNAPLPLISRLLGSLISVAWGGSYLAILLILIGIIPIRFGWFEKIQKNVTTSTSYALLAQWSGGRLSTTSLDMKRISEIYRDPAAFKKFQSTKEFEDLIGDERLKELFSDEKTAEQLRSQNLSQLLSNPKIQAVLQDKELLKKVFALNKKIMEEGLETTPAEEPKANLPKVIETN